MEVGEDMDTNGALGGVRRPVSLSLSSDPPLGLPRCPAKRLESSPLTTLWPRLLSLVFPSDMDLGRSVLALPLLLLPSASTD